MFLNEVDPENKIFEVAEVSFNSLNDKGANSENLLHLYKCTALQYGMLLVKKGIHYLKEKRLYYYRHDAT